MMVKPDKGPSYSASVRILWGFIGSELKGFRKRFKSFHNALRVLESVRVP